MLAGVLRLLWESLLRYCRSVGVLEVSEDLYTPPYSLKYGAHSFDPTPLSMILVLVEPIFCPPVFELQYVKS